MIKGILLCWRYGTDDNVVLVDYPQMLLTEMAAQKPTTSTLKHFCEPFRLSSTGVPAPDTGPWPTTSHIWRISWISLSSSLRSSLSVSLSLSLSRRCVQIIYHCVYSQQLFEDNRVKSTIKSKCLYKRFKNKTNFFFVSISNGFMPLLCDALLQSWLFSNWNRSSQVLLECGLVFFFFRFFFVLFFS